MSALLIADPPKPGSDEWFQYMTGSKIAAVMGLSPYESRYSLWHRMAGIVGPQAEKDIMRRGHYLEPGILAWLADQHPEIEFGARHTMWVSTEYPQFAISPDQLATVTETGELVLIEAKSALDKDVWGEELTDEIPVYYRCQVIWAAGILGIRRAIVGVLTSFLEFRRYEVMFDQDEFALLITAATEFMASLVSREAPDIDTHSMTYEVIKQMHPEIDGESIDVPAEIAVPYTNAKAAVRAAEGEATLWTAKLADLMGSAKTARFNKQIIATRQARGGGIPFVQAARNLTALPMDLLDLKEAS